MEGKASNEAPKVDKEVIKQRMLQENIPRLAEKLEEYKALLNEFDSADNPELKYEIATKIRQVSIFDHFLAKRLIRVEEQELAREYAGIEVGNAVRMLRSLVGLLETALVNSISDEDKQRLATEIQNGTDHYLHNSIGSFMSIAPANESLTRAANFLQAQGREINQQYAQAAILYKIADSEEFKDKIVEMEEKSRVVKTEYTAPSVEEQWQRALRVYELTKTFLDDTQNDSVVQIDPVVTVQKVIDYSKS